MTDNQTENKGQHTSNSDEGVRLRAVESDTHDLKNAIFGNEKQGLDGLVKRVKEIETGKFRKVEILQEEGMSWQKRGICASVVVAICLILSLVITHWPDK
ncbi:MAG: hypothetical protein ACNYPH_08010 [Gammaproteobacteria bacterium WSBS_2016_MAG_OTU1]